MNGNRRNEQARLSRELTETQISGNGHVEFATAYGTPDGIAVEIRGSRTRTYVHPYDRQTVPQEKPVFTDGVDDEEQADLPTMIRTWREFTSVGKITVTPVSHLKQKERRTWTEDVEGIYRDDPRDSSHFYEHNATKLE